MRLRRYGRATLTVITKQRVWNDCTLTENMPLHGTALASPVAVHYTFPHAPLGIHYVTVRVACSKCSRRGAYRLARLADASEFTIDINVTR